MPVLLQEASDMGGGLVGQHDVLERPIARTRLDEGEFVRPTAGELVYGGKSLAASWSRSLRRRVEREFELVSDAHMSLTSLRGDHLLHGVDEARFVARVVALDHALEELDVHGESLQFC